MKHLILPFFLLSSVCSSAQTVEKIIYRNLVDSFSFEYPAAWDSSLFAQLKDGVSDFGAIIKPSFKDYKPVGFFRLKKSDSYGEGLAVHAREAEASLKRIYPDAKIIDSKQTVSKNNILYHSLVAQIIQFGVPRITTEVNIIKGKTVYRLGFTSLKDSHDKLKPQFQTLIDSFTFDIQ